MEGNAEERAVWRQPERWPRQAEKIHHNLALFCSFDQVLSKVASKEAPKYRWEQGRQVLRRCRQRIATGSR